MINELPQHSQLSASGARVQTASRPMIQRTEISCVIVSLMSCSSRVDLTRCHSPLGGLITHSGYLELLVSESAPDTFRIHLRHSLVFELMSKHFRGSQGEGGVDYISSDTFVLF